jgi:hypothetical protein
MIEDLKKSAYILAEKHVKNSLQNIPEVQKEGTYEYNLKLLKEGINIAIDLMYTID